MQHPPIRDRPSRLTILSRRFALVWSGRGWEWVVVAALVSAAFVAGRFLGP